MNMERWWPLIKKLLVVLACFLVFILLLLGYAYYKIRVLTNVVDAQLDAIRVHDIPKAYRYTSSEFQSVTTVADFQDFIDHYDALKNNASIRYTKQEYSQDTATVDAEIASADGSGVPIEYLLTKEKGEWLILGIQIDPQGFSANASQSSKEQGATNPDLKMTYDNQNSHYRIQYPSTWEYERTNDGTLVFSGKRGSLAYYSNVNIQTVLTKRSGGDFSTEQQFMDDIRHQASTQSTDVRFLESGPIVITEADGKKDRGLSTVFTYKYNGQVFKQWQVVVLRHDQQVFYAWAFTSPLDQYPVDLPTAKAMLESWVIY